MSPQPPQALGRIPFAVARILLGLALLIAPLAAQTAEEQARFHVRTWSIEQGLPQVSVENVIRSESGAVWLTCDTGLLRFDGNYFEPVELGLEVGDGITQLVEDPVGERLVTLTKNGLLYVIPWVGPPRSLALSPRLGRLRRIAMPRRPRDTASGDAAPVSPTGSSSAFGVFDLGIALIDLESGQLKICEAEQATDDTRPERVRIATDGSGVWVARDKSVYHGRNDSGLHLAGELEGSCTDIVIQNQWDLWVLTNRRLFHLDADFDLREVKLSTSFGSHTHLLVVGDTIWIGTRSHGLLAYRFDREAHTGELIEQFGQASGLAGYSIRSLEADVDSGIWVGTMLGGFSLIQPRDWEIRPIDSSRRPNDLGTDRIEAVFGVYESTDGSLWAGSRGSGLWRTDEHGELLPMPNTRGSITSIREDSTGRIWAGGWHGIFVQTDEATFRFMESEAHNVRSLCPMPDGTVWAASENGLRRLAVEDDRLVTQQQDLVGIDVWSICNKTGKLYVGTGDGRLFRMETDGSLGEVFLAGTVKSGITSLHWDGSRYWITDQTGGLVALTDQGPRRLGLRGVSPIYCNGIQSVGGALCLTTTRGLLTFDPEATLARADGEVRGVWMSAASLGAVEFTGFGCNASALGKDGTLHLASVAGMATVRPSMPADSPGAPKIVLQSLLIDHVDRADLVGSADAISLDHALELSYRLDHWAASLDITHETRMLGLSDEWVHGSADRRVRFDQLPPGDYRFQVRARHAGQSFGEPVTLAAFSVPVPFYDTTGFYALLGVGLVAIVSLMFRWSRRRELHLQRLVANRTDELRHEVELKEAAEVSLREHRDELDDQVRQRTADLATANERLRVELEERHRLQDELVRAQKLEGVARLAGGLAHDLNNLLTAIVCSSELARQSVPEDSPAGSDIESAQAAAHRASQLARRLLSFAKPQPMREETFDLNALVSSNYGFLRSAIPSSQELIVESGSGLCWTHTDPRQLEQVVVNLVLNASQAIEKNGRITLSVAPSDEGHPNFVALTTKDDGCGMTEEVLSHAMDPFFSTKDDGTGLGLAVCADIVERAGGVIEIESSPGQGTTVRVLLPTAERVIPRPEPKNDRPEVRRDSLRLLLVEDQDSLRSALERALKKRGHLVTTACDALEAEDLFESADGRFDVLVTDLVMPNRSGAELIRSLRKRRPMLPAVLMTGYTPEHLDASVDGGPTAWLAKPFTPDQLSEALDRLLDEHASSEAQV